MQNQAKAAILLATYNGSQFISEFFNSLLLQSLKRFTVFVRDDCSTDNTLDIVRSYSSKLEIVIVSSQERMGPAFSFLTLLRAAGSDFDCYCFADQDDYWHKEKLERSYKALSEQKNQPSLYFTRLEYVNDRLEYIGISPLRRYYGISNSLVENIAVGCTIAINRAARELIVRTTPTAMIMHDWWAYIVMSALGTVIADDFIAVKYRLHGNNAIGASTSAFADYKKRLIRFLKRDRGIFGLFAQTNQFKACYWDLLNREQRHMVDMLVNGKSNIASRLRLALFSPFIRQTKTDTVILRLLFLLNRY